MMALGAVAMSVGSVQLPSPPPPDFIAEQRKEQEALEVGGEGGWVGGEGSVGGGGWEGERESGPSVRT